MKPIHRRQRTVRAILLWTAALMIAGPLAAQDTRDRAWIRILPIAGVPGEDFYVSHYVDRDPRPGTIRDFMGGDQTYDGHQGTDFGVPHLEYMEIGVPVLAVDDGFVTEAVDGHEDRQTANRRGRPGNIVSIRHDNARESHYGHLKKGSLTVRVGQRVRCGQQIAEVGSSGDSDGPHLHFECRENGKGIDPYAPPSDEAESRWVKQPPYRHPVTAVDAGFTLTKIERAFDVPRTAYVREGAGLVEFWVMSVNRTDGHVRHWELLRPDGRVHNFLTETVRDDGNEIRQGLWWLDYPGLVRGKWTLRVSLGRQPATVIPVTVLGAGDPAPPNRPPHRPRASLYPRIPSADAVIICRVANPGVAGDPDLDRVRYRYVWSVDGETVRDAVSAVRADYLPSGAAASGATVRCQVYAGDGQQTAPPTNLSARVR